MIRYYIFNVLLYGCEYWTLYPVAVTEKNFPSYLMDPTVTNEEVMNQ